MAVAEALNKLTENFAKMQRQPLATAAPSAINWFDDSDKSNTMFLQIKIGKQTFRDRIVIVNNLNHNYTIGAAIQRSYCISMGFSITVRHFLSVNGQMIAQSIPIPTVEPVI